MVLHRHLKHTTLLPIAPFPSRSLASTGVDIPLPSFPRPSPGLYPIFISKVEPILLVCFSQSPILQQYMCSLGNPGDHKNINTDYSTQPHTIKHCSQQTLSVQAETGWSSCTPSSVYFAYFVSVYQTDFVRADQCHLPLPAALHPWRLPSLHPRQISSNHRL